MTDRGVSEVLGFVLVFAIITATIGIVYASGFGGLVTAQQAEQLSNMERAFDVLDDNMADLHRRGAPSRATEVKLAGGTISLADRTTVSVTVTNDSDANHNDTFTIHPRPIVYHGAGDQSVVYVLGSTFRAGDDGAAMLSSPDFVVDSDRAVLPMTATYAGTSTTSTGGQGTVLIVAHVQSRSVPVDFTTAQGHTATLNVTITSPRADAWRRYFESNGYTVTHHVPGETVSANRTVSGHVQIASHSVTVEFDA